MSPFWLTIWHTFGTPRVVSRETPRVYEWQSDSESAGRAIPFWVNPKLAYRAREGTAESVRSCLTFLLRLPVSSSVPTLYLNVVSVGCPFGAPWARRGVGVGVLRASVSVCYR